MSKQVKPDVESFARIRVIGVGGSGGNTINHMVTTHVQGVDFIAVNTDGQDLHKSKAKKKIHIGRSLTRGLGTGMNPDLGKQAAEETREEIQDAIKGSDMVFVTCGMGGGTGTGAAPAVAKVARELGALTVGVVTRPFSFEGQQRSRLAETGLSELKKSVDALITIPNDKLLQVVSRDTGIKNAFAMCDDILKQAVEGISELITQTGIINVDFADVRSVMQNAGSALMGIGLAMGDKRAENAAKAAINSPLLDVSISGAKGVLFSIAGGEDLGMLEIQDAANVITEAIDPEARVIFGAVVDETLKKGQVRVTVIATGFPEVANRAPSLFGANRVQAASRKDKDQDVPPATLRPEPRPSETPAPAANRLIIDDFISKRREQKEKDAAAVVRDEKKEDKQPEPIITTKIPAENPVIEETDEDRWGGLPSFLRRK